MTGFAVVRQRRPQTSKWLDGLFDGLNLTAEKFTRLLGRLDLGDPRVAFGGCHHGPARPSGGP